MRRSRFSDEQIIGILKTQEAGIPVSDLCRKHRICDASISKWKASSCRAEISHRQIGQLTHPREITGSGDCRFRFRTSGATSKTRDR